MSKRKPARVATGPRLDPRSISVDQIGGTQYSVKRRALPTQICSEGLSVYVADGFVQDSRGRPVDIASLPPDLQALVLDYLETIDECD